MRKVYNLILLCILLICQQNIVAQSYKLGNQKQSFSYETLYATRAQKSQFVESNNERINTQQTPTEEELKNIQIQETIQKVKQRHKSIIKLTSTFPYSKVYDIYEKIYKKLPYTEENLKTIQKIQPVVISYLNSQGTEFPQIEYQLKDASSMEEQIDIFLSYYNE